MLNRFTLSRWKLGSKRYINSDMDQKYSIFVYDKKLSVSKKFRRESINVSHKFNFNSKFS